MPRGDRTGPWGDGPKTGRMMGYCAGNDHPGYMVSQPGMGRGFGRRFRGGGGFGRRGGAGYMYGAGNYFQGDYTNVSEKTLIENEIRVLKDQLATLEDRLKKTEEK